MLVINAAHARCTLGEISLALEEVWGRHAATTQVVQGAYSATFNAGGGEDEYNVVLLEVE